MKIKGVAIAVLCVGIHGKSLLKQLKEAHREKHGNLKQLKADFGSIEELKQLKREWKIWKKSNKKFFNKEEDFLHFQSFLDNKLEIVKEKESHNHHHTNMTTDGPFGDMDNKDFNRRVLMKPQEKKRRRQRRSAYFSEFQAAKGGFPFEVPEWIKECAPTLSCGLEDIEFSWECAEKVYSAAEIAQAKAMDGKSKVDYTSRENPTGKILVTPVKDQGMCGSCWSFAATGQMEALMLKHNKVANKVGGSNDADRNVWWGLSEQQLIDCSSGREARRRVGPFINHACDGGWPTNGFIHEQVYGGMMDAEDYEYVSGYTYEPQDYCGYDPDMNIMKDRTKQCYMVPQDDEEQLMAAVYHHGAVTIVVDSGGIDWQLYQGGIAHPRDCSADVLNHAVLLVGYGTDEATGEDYWIIRNSWGSWWGENGYMKLARNASNMCGVASMGNFVTYEAYTQY